MTLLARISIPAAMILILSAACGSDRRSESARFCPTADVQQPATLLLGDSVLAWNCQAGESVGDRLAELTEGTLANRAVIGAPLIGRGGIPTQFEPGSYEWVIVNGGANDAARCRCGRCYGLIPDMVAEDLESGVMVDLIDRILEGPANVLILGYYDLPPESRMSACSGELHALNRAYAQLADSRPRVRFIDSGEALDYRTRPTYLASDHMHPGPDGAKAIASLLADAMGGGGP